MSNALRISLAGWWGLVLGVSVGLGEQLPGRPAGRPAVRGPLVLPTVPLSPVRPTAWQPPDPSVSAVAPSASPATDEPRPSSRRSAAGPAPTTPQRPATTTPRGSGPGQPATPAAETGEPAPARPLRPSNEPRQPAAPADQEPAERQVSDSVPAPAPEKVWPAESTATAEADPTAELVSAYLKQLEAADAKDDAAKEAKELLHQAQKSLELAAAAEKKTTEWKAEQQRAPDLVRAAKAKLAEPAAEIQPNHAPQATVPQLEQDLQQAEEEWQEAQKTLAEKEQLLDAKTRADRKAELARLKAKAREQLEDMEEDLAQAGDATSVVARARRLEQQARRRWLKCQLEAYDAERVRWDASAELFPLDRDLAQRRVEAAEKLVTAWRAVVARRRAEESAGQAAEARRLAGQTHPTLRDLANKNMKLAERQATLDNQLKQVATYRDAVEKELAQLNKAFKKDSAKVNGTGASPAVGLLLRTQRDHLPDPRLYAQRLRFADSEMQRVRADLWELENDRGALGDLADRMEHLVAQLETRSGGPGVSGEPRRMMRELFDQRRGFLDKLLADTDKYLQQLSELASVTGDLLSQIDEYTDFIDGQILWIRSAAPLRLDDFTAAGRAGREWLLPGHWWQVVRDVTSLAWDVPLPGILLALVFVLLLLGQAPLHAAIDRQADQATGSDGQQFAATLKAFVGTALAAAFWPAVLLAAGWWLTWSDRASELTLELAHALQAAAPLLYAVQLLRYLCRAGGVGERHLGWQPAGLRRLHRRLTLLVMVGLPLLLLLPSADDFGDAQGREALARLVEIAGLAYLALSLHSMLRPRGGPVWRLLDEQHHTWLYRTRVIWYLAGAVLPLLLAVVVAIGYGYSAEQLLLRWQQTWWLVLGAVLAYALLARGVTLYCRYLATRRKAAAPPPDAQPAKSESPSDAAATEHAEREEVLTQTVNRLHRMLRGVAWLGVLAGATLVWSATVPALQIVTRMPLKPLTKTLSTLAEDGSTTTQTVPVTLGDLLLCLVLIGVTITLARTIPDLLHVSVLQRLTADRGARYAVVLMSRYALTAVGLVLAFQAVGVTWAGLQWLVAAMTVGLGFGLQEIFANFVSGLIILFERPVRIGDTITVNGTTGKVTRMQIRATTITDADRRELIVPNKKFITDEVINWTLSDATTRVVIPIGISYDCDPTRAAGILVDLAKAHPLVLKDPPPNAIFKGFGSSTLDLELRAYVDNGDVRGDVLHELNVAIERAFRKAGIEIAFTQQDIRIRSLPPGLQAESPVVHPTTSATERAA